MAGKLGTGFKKAKREIPEAHPRSLCVCGHPGDGPFSSHDDSRFTAGHGACVFPGCKCEQFTWARFLPWFEEKLRREGRANNE